MSYQICSGGIGRSEGDIDIGDYPDPLMTPMRADHRDEFSNSMKFAAILHENKLS